MNAQLNITYYIYPPKMSPHLNQHPPPGEACMWCTCVFVWVGEWEGLWGMFAWRAPSGYLCI